MDIDQVTRTMASTGRRQAFAGLLAGATALGTHRLAAAKQRKKKCQKGKKCPKRDTCPQQACCFCWPAGGEPELCGTFEPGANNDETLQRCVTFCQSVGGTFLFPPVPDTAQLCDTNNTCRTVPCPLP